MRIASMPVLCRKCGHRWCADTVIDAPARVIIASWKALHCPQPACGADWHRLSFVTTPDAGPDRSAA
ncbi:MAG TPA: hypothetical protein VGI78_19995 [Acetobacteraceae bacterium]|jgi:hypothetical protein